MEAPVSASDVRFPAMGSDVHVIVVGGTPGLRAAARARIAELESRWSRFLPDSEISRINRAHGRPVLVSTDTRIAVAAAIHAWRATGGRFDPTMLPSLAAAGYDRDFAHLEPDDSAVLAPRAAPGCDGIVIDDLVGSITAPGATAIDLGGIGKGLAADLVAAELVAAGASGVCVNVGGDLRVRGMAPSADGWVVGIEHLPDVRIALADGAVATSSSSKRRWMHAGRTVHHLFDPRRGGPADAGVAAVTVIAGSAAAAEMLTKAAFVAGIDGAATVVGRAGATGLLVADSGAVLHLSGIEEYLR